MRKQSRVCVSMIDGVAEMPNDDSIQPQVRKCSEGKQPALLDAKLKESKQQGFWHSLRMT